MYKVIIQANVSVNGNLILRNAYISKFLGWLRTVQQLDFSQYNLLPGAISNYYFRKNFLTVYCCNKNNVWTKKKRKNVSFSSSQKKPLKIYYFLCLAVLNWRRTKCISSLYSTVVKNQEWSLICNFNILLITR